MNVYWSCEYPIVTIFRRSIEITALTIFLLVYYSKLIISIQIGWCTFHSCIYNACFIVNNKVSRVLLLEAGGTMPWIGSVPGLVALLQKSPVDWAYKTEVCRHCLSKTLMLLYWNLLSSTTLIFFSHQKLLLWAQEEWVCGRVENF